MENSGGKEGKERRSSIFGLRRSFSSKKDIPTSPQGSVTDSPGLTPNDRRKSAPSMSAVDENVSDAGTDATGTPKKKKSKIFSTKSLTKMFRSNSLSSTPGNDIRAPSNDEVDNQSIAEDPDHLDECRMSEKSGGTLNDGTTPKKKRFSVKKAVSKIFRSNSLTSNGPPDISGDVEAPDNIGTPGSLRNDEGGGSAAKPRRKSIFSFSSGSKKKSTANEIASPSSETKRVPDHGDGPVTPRIPSQIQQPAAAVAVEEVEEEKCDDDDVAPEAKQSRDIGVVEKVEEEDDEEEEEVVRVDTSFKTKQSFFENLSSASSSGARGKSQPYTPLTPSTPAATTTTTTSATSPGAAKKLFAPVNEDPDSPKRVKEKESDPLVGPKAATTQASDSTTKTSAGKESSTGSEDPTVPVATAAATSVFSSLPETLEKTESSPLVSEEQKKNISTNSADHDADGYGDGDEPPAPPSTPGSAAGEGSAKTKKSSFFSAIKSVTKKLKRASFSPTLISPKSASSAPAQEQQQEQQQQEQQGVEGTVAGAPAVEDAGNEDVPPPPPVMTDDVTNSPSRDTVGSEHFKAIPSPTTVSPERYMYGATAKAAYPIAKAGNVVAIQQQVESPPKSAFVIDPTDPNSTTDDDPSVLKIHAPGKEESELAEMLIPTSSLHPVLVLILRNNAIYSPERFCFAQRFDKLTDLDLGHNSISGTIKGLPPTLQRLDLSHNRITNVSNVLKCIELVELNLSYNNIKIFHGLPPKLQRVDLSHNVISSIIPLRTLALSPSIKRIDLTGNAVIVNVKEWKVVLRTTLTQLIELNGRMLPKPKRMNIPAPPLNGAHSSPERSNKSLAASREDQRVNDAVRTRMHQIKLNLIDESKKLVEDRLVPKSKTLRPDQTDSLTKRLSAPTLALKQKKSTPPVPPALFSTRDLALRKSTQTIKTLSAPPPGKNVGNEITDWLNKMKLYLEKAAKVVTRVVKLSNQEFIDEDDIGSLSDHISRLELIANRDAPLKVEHAITQLSEGDVMKRRVGTVREHVDIMCMLLQQVDSAVLLSAQGVFHLREAVDSTLTSGPGLVTHTTVLRTYDPIFDPSLLARRDFGTRSLSKSATGGFDAYRKSPGSPDRFTQLPSTLGIKTDSDDGFAEVKASEPVSTAVQSTKPPAPAAVPAKGSEPVATPESYMERLRSRATMRALFGSSSALPPAEANQQGSSPALSPARRSLDFDAHPLSSTQEAPQPLSLNAAETSRSPQRPPLVSAKSAPALRSASAASVVETQNAKAVALARIQAKFSRDSPRVLEESSTSNAEVTRNSPLESSEQDDSPPPPPPITKAHVTTDLSSEENPTALVVAEGEGRGEGEAENVELPTVQSPMLEEENPVDESPVVKYQEEVEIEGDGVHALTPSHPADEREAEEAAESYHADGYSHYHNHSPEDEYQGHYEGYYDSAGGEGGDDYNYATAPEEREEVVGEWRSNSHGNKQAAQAADYYDRRQTEEEEWPEIRGQSLSNDQDHDATTPAAEGETHRASATHDYQQSTAYQQDDYYAAANAGEYAAYGDGNYDTEYGTEYDGQYRRDEGAVTEEEVDEESYKIPSENQNQPTTVYNSQDLAFFTDADMSDPQAQVNNGDYYGSSVVEEEEEEEDGKGVAIDMLVPAAAAVTADAHVEPSPPQESSTLLAAPSVTQPERTYASVASSVPTALSTSKQEKEEEEKVVAAGGGVGGSGLGGGEGGAGAKLTARERILARMEKNKK